MYVVIVYDIGEERVNKVCQYLRCHLHWVQKSVFEGELSEGQLAVVRAGLKDLINAEKDSVYIYIARDRKWLGKEVIGVEKAQTDQIL